MKKIYIDIGHGGSDPGAVYNVIKEKDLNLAIGLQLGKELLRCGFDVKYSRTSDVMPFDNLSVDNLWSRDNDANLWGADVLLSIHNNASNNVSADGLQGMYSVRQDGGKDLLECIASRAREAGQNTNAIYCTPSTSYPGKDYWGIIRNFNKVAVIIEYAFVSNPEDIKIIDTLPEQITAAQAISKGVCDYFSIPYIKEDSNINENEGGKNKMQFTTGQLIYVKGRGYNSPTSDISTTQFDYTGVPMYLVQYKPGNSNPLLLSKVKGSSAITGCWKESQVDVNRTWPTTEEPEPAEPTVLKSEYDALLNKYNAAIAQAKSLQAKIDKVKADLA